MRLTPELFARRLKRAMEARGISAAGLAEETGIHASSISRWLHGRGVTVTPRHRTLRQLEKGTVTGSGSFASALDRIAVTVRGTHTERQVAMTLSSTGYYDISYAAQLAADGLTLDGTLSGSGFLGERLVLTRAATTRSLVAP